MGESDRLSENLPRFYRPPVKAHHRKSTHDLCAICRKAPCSLWPPSLSSTGMTVCCEIFKTFPKVRAATCTRRSLFDGRYAEYVEYLSHSGASEHRAQLAKLFRQAGFRGEFGQTPLPMERSMGQRWHSVRSASRRQSPRPSATYYGMKSYALLAKL